MNVPNRLPDKVSLSELHYTGKSIRHPKKLVSIEETFFKVLEYAEIPAYEEDVYDHKVIEIWNEPVGTVARARWLSELTELERQHLGSLVAYG